MPLTQSTIFRPPSPHPKPPLRPAPLQRFTPSPLSPANAPSSPERATDYRRGQAMRSPRSRVPQQITPPWGGAGGGAIRHSSFVIHHWFRGVAVDRGLRFAHPRLYSAAPSGLLWHGKRKSVCEGAKGRKRPRDIYVRQLVIYRSLVYLFKSSHP